MKWGKNVAWFGVIAFLTGWQSFLKESEEPPVSPLLRQCMVFEELYRNIGDSLITPDSASRAFQVLIAELRTHSAAWKDSSCRSTPERAVFPLRGYTPQSSVGGRGRGYRPDEFDFFDANKRKSHPAHDLFIRDRNQDAIDDRMCVPVDVLAFSEGIVLAIREDWTPESLWRGGNYVWVYDPCRDALLYYAHNGKVSVRPGEWVAKGQKLAEVGRTGFNAYPARSETHLHFMYLCLTEEGLPEPVNTYKWLLESTVSEWL